MTDLRDQFAFAPPTACLDGLGQAVDGDARSIPLAAPESVWLVAQGSMELFAVDTGRSGRWHHVGTLDEGAVLCSPTPTARHTLVARPLEGSRLRRVWVGDLRTGPDDGIADRRLSEEECALASGIDRGMAVLLHFVTDGLPPRDFLTLIPGTDVELQAGQNARPTAALLWIEVLSGQIQVGGSTWLRNREAGESVMLSDRRWISTDSHARVRVHDTGQMLARGTLWDALILAQERAMLSLDLAVERRDHAVDKRITTSRRAAESARAHADQALHTVIRPSLTPVTASATDRSSATLAAVRMVAGQLGLTASAPAFEQVTGRVASIEQIAIRSGLRSRAVALKGSWWRLDIGPLVAHRGTRAAPVALQWRAGRYHAVDPVTGRRTPISERNAGQFSDHAVMLYPQLPGRALSSWRLLRFGLRGSTLDLTRMTASVILAVVLGLLVPITTGQVLGQFVPAGRIDLIVTLCLALMAASVAAGAFLLVENIAMLRLEGRFESTAQGAVWDRLLRLPATFFVRHSTGELASAALGVRRIRALTGGTAATVLHAAVVITANLGLLFSYSTPLALLDLAFLTVSAGVFVTMGVRQLSWQRKALEVQHRLTNTVFQLLRGMAKLRMAASEGRAYAHWAQEYAHGRYYQKRIARYQNLITAFNAGFVPLCLLALYLVVAGPAAGTLGVAQFLACSSALAITLATLLQATNSITSVLAVLPVLDRLRPVLDEPLEVTEDCVFPGELSGAIEVSHLCFSYGEDLPAVLTDVSFSAGPGEFIAIVGPSGCGKSTLLRLLLGFEKPSSGTVLYDGQDLSSLDVAEVRRQCGVVLQNAQPLSGSIFQAIGGAYDCTLDEAWDAADMAGLREDIEAMPMGMHTVLNDATTLSGGQRQRLVIAQALIRKPRIVFFDEATSALDNETQRIVTASTQRLQATRIVIAHRLTTVLDADKVVVLSGGRTVECGPPQELLNAAHGTFRQLVLRQLRTPDAPDLSGRNRD